MSIYNCEIVFNFLLVTNVVMIIVLFYINTVIVPENRMLKQNLPEKPPVNIGLNILLFATALFELIAAMMQIMLYEAEAHEKFTEATNGAYYGEPISDSKEGGVLDPKCKKDTLEEDTKILKTHKIQYGETLSQIAEYYGTTSEELKLLNPGIIENIDEIFAGDVLQLP